ncbi:MAG: hypothetical protein LBS62_05375, partial [Clostridiales bacterium]|nr:hypothetical protein [Clostridiales bacterium]
MEMRNCPKCGKLFTFTTVPICKSCEKKEEGQFEVIKAYMDENPSCTLGQLSHETGVPTKLIVRFIRDGRLQITNGMRGEITCESCGKPITTGRYCDACFIEINREVKEMFDNNTPLKRSAKMHYMKSKKL